MSRGTMKTDNNPFGPPSPDTFKPSRELHLNRPPPAAKAATNPFGAAEQNDRGLLEGIKVSPNQEIIRTNNNENDAYKYNTNHSRGAIMLNDYDFNREGSRLKYEYKKVDAELPKYILWFRKGLYVVQMLILAGAIVMGGGAYVAETNGWEFSKYGLIFGHMEPEVVFLPYATAGVCFVTAVIGFVGAKTREQCGTVMLIVFIICVSICLVLSIACTAQAFADMGNRFHYAERQWNKLTAEEERTFEYHNFCCNFDTIEPCCRFGYGVTDCVNEYYCFEKVEAHLIEQFTIIGITSGFQTFNLLCITMSSLVLYCFMAYKTNKKKKKMAEQQQNTEMQRVR